MFGSLIKHDPLFTESSQYLGYTGAIQKILPPVTRKSTITVDLPITVMRQDHSWDFEEKFIGAFDRHGVKLYTTTIHVTMKNFSSRHNTTAKSAHSCVRLSVLSSRQGCNCMMIQMKNP